MTGTAETEAAEFAKIYNLDVIVIPTNRPLVRIEEPDLVYRTEGEKWNAIVDDIIKTSQSGRPALVGTVSIEKSERVSKMLQRKGLKHIVLNAKKYRRKRKSSRRPGARARDHRHQHGRPRHRHSAGRQSRIHGAPAEPERRRAENVARAKRKYVDDEWVNFFHVDAFYRVKRADWDRIFSHFKRSAMRSTKTSSASAACTSSAPSVTARRIDNQLRGRAGRQGDPGSSRFFCRSKTT